MTFSGVIQSVESIWMRNLAYFVAKCHKYFFDRKFCFPKFYAEAREFEHHMLRKWWRWPHLQQILGSKNVLLRVPSTKMY